jgi:hypothetical protein
MNEAVTRLGFSDSICGPEDQQTRLQAVEKEICPAEKMSLFKNEAR